MALYMSRYCNFSNSISLDNPTSAPTPCWILVVSTSTCWAIVRLSWMWHSFAWASRKYLKVLGIQDNWHAWQWYFCTICNFWRPFQPRSCTTCVQLMFLNSHLRQVLHQVYVWVNTPWTSVMSFSWEFLFKLGVFSGLLRPSCSF